MNSEMKSPAISRRQLLSAAAGAGVFMIVPRHVLGVHGKPLPATILMTWAAC